MTPEMPPSEMPPAGLPAYIVPPGVGVVEVDDVVYVATLPQGPIRVLGGSAAAMWHELLAGDPDSFVDRVAEDCGADPEDVAAAVPDFVAELLRSGLIIRG